jgi:hypothetical protein
MQTRTIKLAPEVAALAGKIDFDPDARKYLSERDKRVRPDGFEQYIAVKAEFSRYDEDPYVEPGFTRDPVFDEVEFAIIGGGFGGLLMGARLREVGLKSLRVVEYGGDFGGTWYWNRYPGAMCDVESYVYLPLLENSATWRSANTRLHLRLSNTRSVSPVTTISTTTRCCRP